MSSLLIVDLSAIVHMMWHVSTNDPNPDATSIKTVERVRALASAQPHAVICCDDPSPSFRRTIDPLYKANRKTEDRAPIYHQMRLAIETLKSDGFPVLQVPGFEADDLIASVCAGVDSDVAVTISTRDKDLLQLVTETDSVVVKWLDSGNIVDAAAVKVKLGVPPAQVGEYLMLCGDTADNVKGAEKVGPKTAASLLAEFGSIEAMFAAFDAGATPTMTPNLRTRLQDFRRDVWPTTRELIRLRTDVPISFEDIFKPRVPVGDDVAVFGDDGLDPLGQWTDQEREDHEMLNRPTLTEVAESREAAKGLFAQNIEEAFGPAEARAEIDAAFPENTPTQSEVMPSAASNGIRATEGVDKAPSTPRPHDHLAIAAHAAQQTGATNAAREANAAISADERRPVERVHAMVGSASGQRTDRPGTNDSGRGEESRLRRDGPDRSDAASRPAQDIAASGQQRAETSTSLTPVVVEYERALEPRDLTQAFNLAKSMFQSRLFSAYGSEHAVLSTILAGREFGMPAMASLRAMHIVEGKPMLAADTIRALVVRSGAAEYFRCTERTAERATFVTKRKGEPEMTLTYTLAEGRAAFAGDDKSWAKSGWGKNPADMCVARAGAKLARLVYPDVVHGIYCREEME